MWDEGTLPILRTDLSLILKDTDTITCIALDTWIVSMDFEWVIEFHHSGTKLTMS